jgi:hypothetical protein
MYDVCMHVSVCVCVYGSEFMHFHDQSFFASPAVNVFVCECYCLRQNHTGISL